jgi:integrase
MNAPQAEAPSSEAHREGALDLSVRKRVWSSPQGIEKSAWVVDYVDQRGKRRLRTFARKKEADSFESTARTEIRAGVHTPSSDSITVSEAGQIWLQACKAAGLERTTVDTYRQHLELHIVPNIGHRKVADLTIPIVSQFEQDLRDGSDSANPRSAAMVKRVRGDLSAILSCAQERGFVARNVVRDMRTNRRRGKERQFERRAKPKLKVGVDIPAPQEIKQIIAALKDPWRPILLTAILTGLRASELRGLRWANIDLDSAELHVRERADEYKEIGRPKSEAGERKVPLTPNLVAVLREWKLKCLHTAAGLAFPSAKGEVEYLYNIVRFGLVPAQIAAGITAPLLDNEGRPQVSETGGPLMTAKYSGMHSLRHFYASWCINRKLDGGLELPAKIVQERLGHSTVAMTLDTYGHLFPRTNDAAELAIAERLLLI